MGKKKKKMKKYQSRDYDQKELDNIADCLEEYLYLFDTFIIREGTDEDEYKKAVKVVKKAIKRLREGDGDAVFDTNRYEEMMERKQFMINNED